MRQQQSAQQKNEKVKFIRGEQQWLPVKTRAAEVLNYLFMGKRFLYQLIVHMFLSENFLTQIATKNELQCDIICQPRSFFEVRKNRQKQLTLSQISFPSQSVQNKKATKLIVKRC